MKEATTITMSKPVLDGLREMAKRERRSLSAQIELLVESHFAAQPRTTARRRRAGKGVAA